ncbi:hypothetical protein R0137_06325 [Congregibacter brevis]|uniref:Uncharacterized protein n=1 Tax=Congregibacter brevis TaxID=3081201 RepID=A0ABZ0II42_9GAMM|nr:hypothetical protein R0137_06325 [Congregibacter sp. IMCC45268]
MEIRVPQGESRVLHFVLTPRLPVNGKADDWAFVCTSESSGAHVTELDVAFSKSTPLAERRNEAAILVVEIDRLVQTSTTAWRFHSPGFLFAHGHGDVKNCFDFSLGADQTTMVTRITCLDDVGENFKFSFAAMRTDMDSGACDIYASADPQGSVGRPD